MNQRRIRNRYQKYKIDINDFKIMRPLGQGAYGSVFLVQNTSTRSQAAAKIILRSSDNTNYKQMVNNEIKILIKLKHPTIVKFIGYSLKDFYEQENVTIFTEFARNGSLDKYLQSARKGLADSFYDNTYRQIILIGIARGMMYLHQNNIIHRDLKPGNILLDENMHPLIADFGFSKSQSIYSMSQKTNCGTCVYKAPEIITGKTYTAKVDVYAFGILMYEIVTDSFSYPLLESGELTPFNLEKKVVDEDYRPTFDVPVKESIHELIKKCWSKNPKERPNFEDIFKKLAYGIENSNDDIFVDGEEYNYNEDDIYYLDNVNADAIIEYAEMIKSDFSSSAAAVEEENEELKKKLDIANGKIELTLNPLKKEMTKKIDHLQKENDELKKKLADVKKSDKSDSSLPRLNQLGYKKESVPVASILPKEIKSVFQMKITEYAKIQTNLSNLKPDASDRDIDELISSIPRVFLNQKDDLMMICQLFAIFARNHQVKMRRLVIKLFERIMMPIKRLLKDESSFFWCIFGGFMYFKLWMYEEGLISIEQIILGAKDGKLSIIEYFLPEIIDLQHEIFEKELKYVYQKHYSKDSISETKEIRIKHFKWLRESADYNDFLYREIENDSLRLAIKTDDIESFKRIFTQLNLSADSTICDNIYDSNFVDLNCDMPIINYASTFNATKIFKFLIAKGADVSSALQNVISSNNKELYQILKEKNIENFFFNSLLFSICYWNNGYISSDFDMSKQNESDIKEIIRHTFFVCNFSFYIKFLDPFFNKNEDFVTKNIHEIVNLSFRELTCLFTKEFIKNPNINVNFRFTDNTTLLKTAIYNNNHRAVEILTSNPKLNINTQIFRIFSAIEYCCVSLNLKITEIICSHPKIKINNGDAIEKEIPSIIKIITNGGFYHAQIFLKYHPKLEIDHIFVYFASRECFKKNNFYSLKILLKHVKDTMQDFDFGFSSDMEYRCSDKDKYLIVQQILSEIL